MATCSNPKCDNAATHTVEFLHDASEIPYCKDHARHIWLATPNTVSIRGVA